MQTREDTGQRGFLNHGKQWVVAQKITLQIDDSLRRIDRHLAALGHHLITLVHHRHRRRLWQFHAPLDDSIRTGIEAREGNGGEARKRAASGHGLRKPFADDCLRGTRMKVRATFPAPAAGMKKTFRVPGLFVDNSSFRVNNAAS